MIKTVPTLRVYDTDAAARRVHYRSRAAAGRAIERSSAKVSLQRRKQLLARVQETAADIRARP